MLVALQLFALYVTGAMLPVIVARLFAGTDGARSTAYFVYWHAPKWLVINTFWLLVDCLSFFFPRTQVAAFVSHPPPTQDDPIMQPKSQPPPSSLAEKMQRRQAEELNLIAELTGQLVPNPTLRRAFELDLIDRIGVHHHQTYTDDSGKVPLVSMSFELRRPIMMGDSANNGESDDR